MAANPDPANPGAVPVPPVPPAPRLAPVALSRPLKPPPKPRAVEQASEPVVLAPRVGRVTQCCWPIGEPGTRTFHFCDVPSAPGRPYCPDHARHAYVKVQHAVPAMLHR